VSAQTLLAVAHGTRAPAGQAQTRALLAAVARRRPGLAVSLSYVDVQRPRLADVVGSVGAVGRLGAPAVAVPLLLASGYHVRVDIPAGLAGTDAVASRPLGPDPLLVDLLCRAIAATGPRAAVVLAAAGSTDPRACAEVAGVADALSGAASRPIHVGYAAAGGPRVPEVVAALRRAGARRVVIAAYLLVDGLFYRSLYRAGADAVTPPLATQPAVADLVLRRYDAVADQMGHTGTSPAGYCHGARVTTAPPVSRAS
jgi:sirohydrochlorin ferrochelatase